MPDLPWPELGAGMEAAGWLNANNKRGRIKAGDLDIEVAGVHDSHIDRDRYDEIAGPADPTADLRLGVMHSPEPSVLDRFAADGYDLLLAGHTHGGQICLPWYGALVTNCGIDRERVRGLHRHPADGDDPERPWLHVSAGLGTSPWAPVPASAAGRKPRCSRWFRDPPPGPLDFSSGRRGVAQLGSALRSGRRGRRFKSGHPDQVTGHLRSSRHGL